MKIHELAPEMFQWDNVSRFWEQKCGLNYPSVTADFKYYSEKHMCNWVLFTIFAAARTSFWQNKFYTAEGGWNIFGLGEKFLTHNKEFEAAAEEFNKFENSIEFADDKFVEELYSAIEKHCKGEPTEQEPLPPIPPIEPKPDNKKEEPSKPTPDNETAPKSGWKEKFSWVGKAAGILLALVAAGSLFLPIPAGIIEVVKAILKFIQSIFGG